MYQNVFPFQDGMIPLVCRYHIPFIYSSFDGHFGCVPLLAIVNNAVVIMGVQIFFKSPLSILLGTYPEVDLVDHVVILCLICEESPNSAVPYTFLPVSKVVFLTQTFLPLEELFSFKSF